MLAVYEAYKDEVDFYAINLTAHDHLEDARAFVDAYALPFPVLLDQRGEVADRYEVISIPTTYYVDRDGVIRSKIIGVVDRISIENLVKELVK